MTADFDYNELGKLAGAQVCARIEVMRRRAIERDERQRIILAMRDNRYNDVAPGLLPDEFGGPLVANLIDTAAHDLAEVTAPLPSVTCATSSQTSDKDKKFANKRALIANHYLQSSRLKEQMYIGSDRYYSFGYMAYIVEPDLVERAPFVRVDTSVNPYFTLDHRGRVAQYATIMLVHRDELCLKFPEYTDNFKTAGQARGDNLIEIAEWYDKKTYQILLPEQKLILLSEPNILKDRCPIRIVRRPAIEADKTKGQFDDVVWVQMARALTASYTMSAVQQSVEAPIIVPDDVNEIEMGPFSVFHTKNPQGVGRLSLNVPSGLFPEQASLAAEQRVGSRYPEGRSGNIDASIITGQGVQALMGTFDTQVQTFQRLNESALEDVVSMCFEMDQALWPEVERSVRVKDAGSPTEIKYKPSRDIAGDYSVDVAYGAVAGLDPNRSLIFLLQAVSGGFMSRETGRKHMPVDIDHIAETKRMELESMRDALVGSISASAQAIPAMAAQGQDPRQVVQQYAQIMALIEKGDPIETAVGKVLAPKEDPAAEPAVDPAVAALQQAQAAAPPQAAGPPGPQAGQSPGQDLLMGLAGITPSGNANLQSNVSTRAPVQ